MPFNCDLMSTLINQGRACDGGISAVGGSATYENCANRVVVKTEAYFTARESLYLKWDLVLLSFASRESEQGVSGACGNWEP